jgi:hypothetical protein
MRAYIRASVSNAILRHAGKFPEVEELGQYPDSSS